MDHKLIGRGADGARGDQLARVVDALPGTDAAAVRAWLSDGDSGLQPGMLLASPWPTSSDTPIPADDDPEAIRQIGVIGGGTAGYLTALALKHKRPWLEVSLVESPDIPIIGVGESTVAFLVMFLHHYLDIDAAEFYRCVGPTWKIGTNFEWGPHPDGFRLGFDASLAESIGMVGAIEATGNISGSTIGSAMVMGDKAPVFDVNGQPVSLMKYIPFAYHLDNRPLVEFLTKLAARLGVRHVPATLNHVATSGPEWVDHLRTDDGRELRYDLYVDCTGFRSLLLGKAFETPFVSYASSLATDSAITGNVDHHGHIKPYTEVITMNAGWNWGIPTPDSDHRGYVFSSAFLSDDAAADELARRYPGITEPHVIRFRSGRRTQAWRGNVMAIGNSFAFAEPLEANGLVMSIDAIISLVATLPASWSAGPARELVNTALNQRWDQVRWLLAVHYRFNTRLDTPFWKEARSSTDISGFQQLIDLFSECAPLSHRNGLVQDILNRVTPNTFSLRAMDSLLLGMQVPTRRLLPTGEPPRNWQSRRAAAAALVRRALPVREALAAFATYPELNEQLLEDDDSWAGRRAAVAFGMR
jgi:tryptophan 7-halogenase